MLLQTQNMRKAGPNLLVLICLGLIWTIGYANKRIPAPRFAGPYKITLRNIGNQTDEYTSTGKLWAQLNFIPPKSNQLQNTWGYFYGGVPVTDNHRIEIRVSQWSNNEWKQNAFVLKFDRACSAALFHAKKVVDLLYKPRDRRCPFPEVGLREIKNQTFEAVFPHFPVLPYNRYLFAMAVRVNDETQGVAVADGNTTPKVS